MGLFTAEELAKHIYAIRGEGCDSYLLPGDNEAVMVDSGMSAENIRAFAEKICNQPVNSVINTHSHFDHTAGNGFFDVVYGTAGISRSAKNTMGADPARFKLDYIFTMVRDGDVISPGGKLLEIIELDCHSPGNIAILDITNRALFPGDEIDLGQVLLLPGYAEVPGQLHAKSAASVETYLRALLKLKNIADRFDSIYPAHNGAPVGLDSLDKFITLAEHILNGLEGSEDCSGRGYNASMNHFPIKDAHYRRAELNGVSLVYCADLVRDSGYQKKQPEPATELHRICAGTGK
jgi:glyoxylase-like metal-dependent hydrolase (beta-lactamase superfamily II)